LAKIRRSVQDTRPWPIPPPFSGEHLLEGFDPAELIDEFKDEARGQIDLLDAALLTLERAGELPAEELVSLQRALHTLKGNSAMLGLGPLRDFVHRIETFFEDPPHGWSRTFLDRLFEAAALLRRALDHSGTDEQETTFARLANVDLSTPPETVPDAVSAEPEPADIPTPVEEVEPEPVEDADLGDTGDVLRIPFRKLDALMEEVGELVAFHAALGNLVHREREALTAVKLYRPLRDHTGLLGRLAETLRDSVMDLRLVPAGRIFRRFPTMARDIARAQEKEVQVRVEGEETQIDKTTMEALAEPILHLVRNAIDHGIETPEAREAAGKPRFGTLILRAEQRGDVVRITVRDDGRGLDREAILGRGRELGVVRGRGRPEDEEIDDLIFHPGFSTRAEVTDVSGRGVGLDVVRSSVQRLRGRIEVATAAEGGTRFRLELPLTLAILPPLFFEVAGETLGIPARDVLETIGHPSLRMVGRAPVVMHHDALVPLLHPARIFDWNGDTPDADDAPPFAVVVRGRVRTVAVAADRLLDHREVVAKALPSSLGAPRGVSGATVLPSGRAALLLDPSELTELNLERTPSR